MVISGLHAIGALDDDKEDYFTMDGRSFPAADHTMMGGLVTLIKVED
jgi:hypothetical protein